MTDHLSRFSLSRQLEGKVLHIRWEPHPLPVGRGCDVLRVLLRSVHINKGNALVLWPPYRSLLLCWLQPVSSRAVYSIYLICGCFIWFDFTSTSQNAAVGDERWRGLACSETPPLCCSTALVWSGLFAGERGLVYASTEPRRRNEKRYLAPICMNIAPKSFIHTEKAMTHDCLTKGVFSRRGRVTRN